MSACVGDILEFVLSETKIYEDRFEDATVLWESSTRRGSCLGQRQRLCFMSNTLGYVFELEK